MKQVEKEKLFIMAGNPSNPSPSQQAFGVRASVTVRFKEPRYDLTNSGFYELPERYQKKIIIHLSRFCWLWTGELDKYNYGRAWYKGFRYQAHRLILWLVKRNFKLDDKTKVIDHLCGNRDCVNPAHLEPITQSRNMKRIHRRRKTIDQDGNLVGGKQ